MSTRFEAERILRDAASGAFPAEGDTLLRTADGWIFSNAAGTTTEITFLEILGVIARGQLPPEVAFEDEVNIFEAQNTFQQLVFFLLGLQVDFINEQTPDAGVTIDGVLLKDGKVDPSAVDHPNQEYADLILAHVTNPHDRIFNVLNFR